jgi:NEDD4-binding protein 2
MNGTLVLMQGIPGSGKSTVARMLAREYNPNRENLIYSTDEFWYEVPVDEIDGVPLYNYDPARRAEAHRWNQQRVVQAMQQGIAYIIVDNTNIQRWQVQPYLALAQIFDYEVQVVRVQVPVEVAIERNAARSADRQVPEEVIRQMADEMEDLL